MKTLNITTYAEGFDERSRITRDPSKITNPKMGLKSDHVLRFKGGRYMLGVIPEGVAARQIQNGPEIPGPWAFSFQLSTVIAANPEHGTGAESRRLIEQGLEHEVEEGDELVMDGNTYTIRDVRYSATGSRLVLDLVDMPARNLTEALKRFAQASADLEAAWREVGDDGNHPIVTSGAYPFADSFDEVDNGIQNWLHGVVNPNNCRPDEEPGLKLNTRTVNGIVQDDEPDIDDSVKSCPECETPNQFGEVCARCRQEIQDEGRTDMEL